MSSDAPAIFNSSIRYSSYTPAQKRATQKYRANNKDKVNEQRKAYYEARKEADPEFLAYKREKAKEYYQRKKASIPASEEPVEVPETPMPESVIESIPAIVESPLDSGVEDVPVEVPSAKVKKPRAPRKKAIKPDELPSLEVPVELPAEIEIVPPTPKPSKPRGKTIFIPPIVKEETPIV
jgi:hypothetical protein